MRFSVIDCCPAPTGPAGDHMAEIIEGRLKRSGARAESLYRGSDPQAAKYLRGTAPCFKHDQAWIYANYPAGVANPPGLSTHELFNDGTAYPLPAGAKLEPWQLGQDIDDAHVRAYMDAARDEGAVVTQTYPGSAVEYHHVNDRFRPRYVPPFDPIERGEKGRRVRHLSKRLHFIHKPGNGPYLERPDGNRWVVFGRFTDHFEDAVKEFQRDHNLKDDGVVGLHTFEQIQRTFRRQWKERKKRVPRRHLTAIERRRHRHQARKPRRQR